MVTVMRDEARELAQIVDAYSRYFRNRFHSRMVTVMGSEYMPPVLTDFFRRLDQLKAVLEKISGNPQRPVGALTNPDSLSLLRIAIVQRRLEIAKNVLTRHDATIDANMRDELDREVRRFDEWLKKPWLRSAAPMLPRRRRTSFRLRP